MLSFEYNGEIFEIEKELIPENSYLGGVINFNNGLSHIVLQDDVNLDIIIPLLKRELLLTQIDYDDLYTICDFHNMYIYDILYTHEKYIRDNLYNPDFDNHEIHNDYYGLYEITEEFFNMINPDYSHVPNNVIFTKSKLTKRPWKTVLYNLNKIHPKIQNVVVAGGAVFSSMFDSLYSDIDMFIYGVDEIKAIEITNNIILSNKQKLLTRTQNAITFIDTYDTTRQIILRLYKYIHEIIHGFDIDSSCVLYDGNKIWCTGRFMLSMLTGYNQVNFDLLSPSYEYRLIKYANKGMRVFIKNFDRLKITRYLKIWYKTIYNKRHPYNQSLFHTFQLTKDLQGLDILLFSEYNYDDVYKQYIGNNHISGYSDEEVHCFNKANFNRMHKIYDKLALEHSDYSPVPFIDKKNAMTLGGLLEFNNNIPGDISTKLRQKYDIYSSYNIKITNPYKHGKISIISIGIWSSDQSKRLKFILNIPKYIYSLLESLCEITIPKKISFKTTNPGEQMTGTFHKTVLEDNDIWYNGLFYKK